MADFPNIVDRNVQHPNRFLSSEVEPGVVELTPDPGAGETGTELNAELFDKIKEYVDDTSNVMGYLPGGLPGKPINGFNANTVDRVKPSLIPIYNGINTPSQNAAVLETIPYSGDWVMQYFHEIHTDGGNLFHRVFRSGTTWSAWGQLVGIEATGTTGGWSWIKYTDGRAEASITGTQKFVHNTASGSMYIDTNQYPFNIALPSGVFVGTPLPFGNCMGSTSTFLNLWVNNGVVNMYTAAFGSRPDNNVGYNIKLEGRWK